MDEKNISDKKMIGLLVVPPKKTCDDVHCPFHGVLSVRGNVFLGKVISAKVPKSLTVVWERKEYIRKYERYAKRRTRVRVHCPMCIDAKEGDNVKIAECRPISKTKHFVVVENLNIDDKNESDKIN